LAGKQEGGGGMERRLGLQQGERETRQQEPAVARPVQ
jgi:hypothetical protein